MWRACGGCFAADADDVAGAGGAVVGPSVAGAAALVDPSPLSSSSPFLLAHTHAHARATVAAGPAGGKLSSGGVGTAGGLRAALLHKKAAAAAAASAVSAFLPTPGDPQPYCDHHPLTATSSSSVQVAVVVRPLLGGERAAGAAEVVSVRHPSTVCLPPQQGDGGDDKPQQFAFDRVYRAELGAAAALKALHEECARPVIDRFCRGFNGTIMAYGQTGGGKTFAMGTMGGGGAAAQQAAAQAAAQAAVAAAAAAAAAAGAGGGASTPPSTAGHATPGSKTRRRRPPDASDNAANADSTNDEALLAATCSAQHGLIPRALHRVFDYAARAAEEGTYDVHLTVSYVQVLNDAVLDLLGEASAGASGAAASATVDAPPSPATATTTTNNNNNNPSTTLNNLPAVTLRETKEGEIVLEGAADIAVATRQEVLALLALGNARRATAPHLLNAESSRSHAVLTLTMTQKARLGLASGARVPRELRALRSKLRLVDLAGSERSKQTGSKGARFAEGVAINRGLLALGNVINALAADGEAGVGTGGGGGGNAPSPAAAAAVGGAARRRGKQQQQQEAPQPQQQQQQHIPYRDSKLTRLLQDSLGGNSETLLVACVAPSLAALDQSRSTLRYASRARRIRNQLSIGSVAAGNTSGSGGGSSGLSAVEEEALRAEVRRLEAENARLRGALVRAGLAAEAAG